MSKTNSEIQYRKAYQIYVNLEKDLRDENNGDRGFFNHNLGNLAMGIFPFWIFGKEGRDIFKEAVKGLRAYRTLLRKHPDFRKGELTEWGYFNTLEGRTIDGEGDKKAILDWKEYVDYARRKLA